MSIFFIFLIGLFFGSFLNVLADRLPHGESILGRSHCDFCKHELGIKDLIPIVSFVSLKGKCRYCGKKLSFNYPLLELTTGILFVASYLLVNLKVFLTLVNVNILIQADVLYLLLNIPLTPYMLTQQVFALVITSILVVIFFADLRYGIIPDLMTIVGLVATAIWLLIINQGDIFNHLIAATGTFVFFYSIYILTKRKGIGFGDVKFALFMGLLLGITDTFLALYIAFLTGGLVGIILILWKKKERKSTIAFGPFLVIGTYVSFFLSQAIIPLLKASLL